MILSVCVEEWKFMDFICFFLVYIVWYCEHFDWEIPQSMSGKYLSFTISSCYLYVVDCVLCLFVHKLTIAVFQVILNVILNLAAIALGIAAIVLYMINIGMLWVWRMYHEIYWPGFYARPPYKVILDEGQALVIVSVQHLISGVKYEILNWDKTKRLHLLP